MYTYNLCLVFGAFDSVVTIVCASEDPIDKENVNQVAAEHFNNAFLGTSNASQIVSRVVNGIKAECDCQAVTVTADSVFHIRALK